jgi:hypothetical protein
MTNKEKVLFTLERYKDEITSLILELDNHRLYEEAGDKEKLEKLEKELQLIEQSIKIVTESSI